jgi:hypothetical protein
MAQRVADDLLQSGLTSLGNAIGGALGIGKSSGGIGGFLGSLLSFDGGGYTGDGPRTGGLDGKGGFPAILHPNETVIDHTKSPNGAQEPVQVVVTVQPSGEFDARVQNNARAVVRVETPPMISEAFDRGRENRAFR